MEIKCSNMIKKNSIDSYYEFLFILALAAESGRRGILFDISDMQITNKDLLSKKDIDYLHYLRDIGVVVDGSNTTPKYQVGSEEEIANRPEYWFDVNAVTKLYPVLFEDKEDCYFWSLVYAYDAYGKDGRNIMSRKKLGNTLLHLFAHMYFCFYLGERQKKEVVFHFKNYEVCCNYTYIDLYGCIENLPYLKGMVRLDLYSKNLDKEVDNDFYLHYNIARHAGTFKDWNYKEKFSFFKELGLKEGSIAVLYERGRMSATNIVGAILSSTIIRIDKIDENLKNAGWYVTRFNVNKTLEECEDDYYGIDPAYRSTFSDLLKPKMKGVKTFLSFENVGIDRYFSSEENIIIPIEGDEVVSKKVTINGKKVNVDMDDVDAVYWILSQRGVKFDKELYRGYYNDGKPLMWDICNDSNQEGTNSGTESEEK